MTTTSSKEHIILFDNFSANDIKRWNDRCESLFDHHWSEYSYYANERSKLASKIRKSLHSTSVPYQFDGWFRILTLKYNDNPLSAEGCRLHSTGGRYNFGGIDITKFPCFSALYIASDHDTAIAEKFSRSKKSNSGLEQTELPGMPISYTAVKIQGKLDSIIDVTNQNNLRPFINVIKKIQVPSTIIKSARKLRLDGPTNIRTPLQLQKALQLHDRNFMPNLFNIPSASQIFGHIVYSSNIQGILYRSKYTESSCLAIFPGNFCNQSGYVKLSDSAPEGMITRLDKTTWQDIQ